MIQTLEKKDREAGSAKRGLRLRDLLRSGAELRETHISWVYLTDQDAFKIKKPVSLGFLDFSSLAKRRRACLAEVRLNQRLAPGVYRGLVPVTLDRCGHRCLSGSGKLVDWAVHMARLPDRDRCDQRLKEGRLGVEGISAIARRLAAFHSRSETSPSIASFGSLKTLRRNLEENFTQTRDSIRHYLTADQADAIEQWQTCFLDQKKQQFEGRIRDGRIRDCHGDLRLEHIYMADSIGRRHALKENKEGPTLPSSICIIDCIEFNRRFRYSDVCSDVAFLAMDLAWQGQAGLAELFLAAYARESNDFDFYPLVDFYESYRAFLRGKVSSMLAASPGILKELRQQAVREARRYYLLALASERRPLLPPSLVAVGGTIASGKSTVAQALSLEMTAPVISSDRTRKFMLGLDPLHKLHQPAWHGAYSFRFSRQVYKEILRRAEAVLSSNRPVILDASFRSRYQRESIRRLASRLGVPFSFVECRSPRKLCLERLRQRSGQPDVSDGRSEIFDAFRSRWEPACELAAGQHIRLDTSLPLEKCLANLRMRLTTWPIT